MGYLCSTPVLFRRLFGPNSFFVGDGNEFCTSLFSFANKNLFPSGAPTDTAGEKRRWVLNTWTKFATKIHHKTNMIVVTNYYCITEFCQSHIVSHTHTCIQSLKNQVDMSL